jgi:hypothetical protein
MFKQPEVTSISNLHSQFISARGILSHLWTLLGVSNMLIANYCNVYPWGIEQIFLILLASFPSQLGSNEITQYGAISRKTSCILHYFLIGTHWLLSCLTLAVNRAWMELGLHLILNVLTVLFHLQFHKVVILLEGLSATCISAFYMKIVITCINK